MSDPDDLERWAADARVDEAAAERARAGWVRRQGEEEATLAGLLVDVAESGTPVAVDVAGAGRLTGRVLHVGADHVGLALDHGPEAVVVLDALGWVVPRPGSGPTTSASRPVGARSAGRHGLGDALAGLAADRPRVQLHLRQGDARTGRLVAVGADVVTLGLDADAGTVHAPLAAVTVVVVLDRVR